MTRSEIARALEDTRRQLAESREDVRFLEAQALQLEAMLAEATKRRLHHGRNGSRLDSTMPEKSVLSLKDRLQRLAADPKRSKAIKIAAANAMRAGVISEARVLLLEQNVTDSQVAEVCGVARPTVQAWHAKRNPIAEEHAKKILGEWAVPLSAWR